MYIEGKLRTRQWEDNNNQKHSTTEIVAFTLQMLGQAAQGAPAQEEYAEPPAEPVTGDDTARAGQDDDVPF